MAHIETWYKCPCGAHYATQREANQCAISHVRADEFAVSERYQGKAVRVWGRCAPGSMGSREWALQEAELSDNTEERKRQLMERRNSDEAQKQR